MHGVIHIPHAWTHIPDDVRATLLLDPDALTAELLVMTDWYTDELFALPSDFARTVVFPASRLVVDPERFSDDDAEAMAKKGMGVIYERSSRGSRLRNAPTSAERKALIALYYAPHHAALTEAVRSSLAEDGQCLIVDGHSFSSTPLPHEPDQDPDRPDICVGTDDYHTPHGLTERATTLLRAAGWRVEVNRPFAGAIVPPAYYGQDKRVSSIMIEVNRSVYMDEQTGAKRAIFGDVSRTLSSVIRSLMTSN